MVRVAATRSISLPVLDEDEVALETMKFLSEPNRLRILRILSRRESCVCDLIEHLNIPQPSVSYHLKRLRDAGLVRPRRQAQWVYYSIDPVGWERFMRPILQFCLIPELPPEAAYGASHTCDTRIPDTAYGASDATDRTWPD
jgi:DNA-binding transcriptional ArsR family regulator